MEITVAVIGALAPTLAAGAAWASLYRRTNGSGPLGQKLDALIARVDRHLSDGEVHRGLGS